MTPEHRSARGAKADLPRLVVLRCSFPVRTKWAYFLITVLLSVVLVLSACVSAPTIDIQQAHTEAAQTVVARFTQDTGETAVAQLTQLANQPTPTTVPPTQAVESTPTLTPTLPPPSPEPSEMPSATPPPTQLPPTATVPQASCDAAQFIADVTIPPGSTLLVGARFIKIWRLQNTGSCTWTNGYTLVFTGGDPMGSPTAVAIPGTVSPGQSIDLFANMIVPGYPGIYQGAWMLHNPSGAVFGVGQGANAPLEVRITAFSPAVWNNYPYDLATNFCAATWQSAAGSLTCPGNQDDSAGSVTLLDRPALETRRAGGLALLTRPNEHKNGWIVGQFPLYQVNSNDHFLAEVGCLKDSPGCDLSFQLDYRAANGSTGNIGAWREVYDGLTTVIDIDLSPLAGRTVQFILKVVNQGKPRDANAIWAAPRIQNMAPTTGLILDWTQENASPYPCAVLRIYATSRTSAEARAYSCERGEKELGRTTLDPTNLDLLQSWFRRLKSFDGEVYKANPSLPIASWFSFTGQGVDNASDADIQAINRFAARLFALITGTVSPE